MTRVRGAALAAAAAASLAACGPRGAAAGPRAEAAALPQVTCGGTAPAASSHAVQAQVALNRTLVATGAAGEPYFQAALVAAREGIAADSANPLHHFLAGQAHAGLGQTAEADAAWNQAERLCRELGGEIRTVRQNAYVSLFAEGMRAFQAADTATAVSAWTRASQAWPDGWDAHYNLGVLYAGLGDPAKSVAAYRAALRATETNGDTTAAVRAQVAETRANAVAGLLNAGALLFQAERYDAAAAVFRTLADRDRNHRDAWYNLALAQYKLARWDDLVPVAERVTELDPLNHNAWIVLFNAHKGIAERGTGPAEQQARQRALQVLQRAEALPVRMDAVRLVAAPGQATVHATLEGGEARAGTPIALDVVFWGADGRVGTATITATAPAKGATIQVQATAPVSSPAAGITYSIR